MLVPGLTHTRISIEKNSMNDYEDGYRLWLRYPKVDDSTRLAQYRSAIDSVSILVEGMTYNIIKYELDLALPALLDKKISIGYANKPGNTVVAGTVNNLKKIYIDIPQVDCYKMGEEGFLIRNISTGENNRIVITANSDTGVITGIFHFLRLLQTYQDVCQIDTLSCPRIHRRLLSHWDNIDGSIERGYAGRSLWKWTELPDKINRRYRDYARACASIGINGTILNNVNSQAESLSTEYLNYLYIKELKDRQGTIYVPTNPNTGVPMFKSLGQ